jgi:hypothetical protein
LGTISLNKLGGWSLILGPILTLVFYFLQPGVAIIDVADPAVAAEAIPAIINNATLSKISSVLIPIGLLVLLYGIFSLQKHISANRNGDALSRYGALLILVGVLGWITGLGANLAIAGADLKALGIPVTPIPAEAIPGIVGVYGVLYAMTLGIGTVSGILAAAGFLALALAVYTRDDFNKNFALVAAIAAVVQIVTVIIGGVDSGQLALMNNIGGVIFLIHAAWLITVGLKLTK